MSVSTMYGQAYRAFLVAVAATWVNAAPVEPSDPLWRPFRGTPSLSSQKQALVMVQTMFEVRRDAGYLEANQMRSMQTGFARTSSRINVARSNRSRVGACAVMHCAPASRGGANACEMRRGAAGDLWGAA
jgi:hypothetical protein